MVFRYRSGTNGSCRFPAAEQDELPHELLQGGSEIVDDLSSDRSPAVLEVGWPSWLEPENVARSLVVYLTDDGVGVRLFPKRQHFFVERLQLLESPLVLRPDAV